MPLGRVLTSERAEKIKDDLTEFTGLRGDQVAVLAICLSLGVYGKKEFSFEDATGYELNPQTLTRNGSDPWVEALFSLVYGRDLSVPEESETLTHLVRGHLNHGLYLLQEMKDGSGGRLDAFLKEISQYVTIRHLQLQDRWRPVVHGIKLFVGTDVDSSNRVEWEFNNTEKSPSPHVGIAGRSGYGKTQLLKALLAQLCGIEARVPCLVFDYKGDFARDTSFVQSLNAQVLNPEHDPLPIHLFALPDYSEKTIKRFAARMQESFSAAVRMGEKQQYRLRQAIIEAFNRRRGKAPPYPDWREVAEANCNLSQSGEADTVSGVLDKIVTYELFADSTTSVPNEPFYARNTIIDLSALSAYQELVVYLLLDHVYYDMRSKGDALISEGWQELRLIIALDEAHHYLQEDNPVLGRLLREGRSFGIAVFLSTQTLSDFSNQSVDYSELINNVFLFQLAQVKRADLTKLLRVSREEARGLEDEIHRLKPGQCVWSRPVGIGDRTYSVIEAEQFYKTIGRDI